MLPLENKKQIAKATIQSFQQTGINPEDAMDIFCMILQGMIGAQWELINDLKAHTAKFN